MVAYHLLNSRNFDQNLKVRKLWLILAFRLFRKFFEINGKFWKVRLQVVPLSLSPSCPCVTRKKTAKKKDQKWPREILALRISRGHFTVFFRVKRDGLSERGTTRSLWTVIQNFHLKYPSGKCAYICNSSPPSWTLSLSEIRKFRKL